MVDMEVKMRGEKSHSQEQPQYSRSAYRGLEKHIHKQMMNQLTAKSYNSLAHRVSWGYNMQSAYQLIIKCMRRFTE